MQYWDIKALRKHHPTWRLLLVDNAPFIIGFFHHAFIRHNRRSIAQSELITLLDDYLFYIRESEGPDCYPKAARDYLEDWARGEMAFLRKYFPKGTDEAEFDLTPGSEKAIEWLRSLEQKQFVGTESRLNTVFQLLHELVQLTETDRERRIADLQRQKATLDEEINRLKGGASLSFDSTQVKERFYQIEETAQHLLADFRQVEDNFRKLDQQVRETIKISNKSKGELLDEIFGDQDAIQNSDQGKSFRSFWAFLMSPQKQQEMAQWLERIYELPPVQSLQPDDFLRNLRFRLLDAGDKAQRTSSMLVEQLRRYLDDQVWLENKRIAEIINTIERNAVAIKTNPPEERVFIRLDAIRPALELPMSRGLYRPPTQVAINDVALKDGGADFDSDVLYQQQYVDVKRLKSNIRLALQHVSQISLEQLCQTYPLQRGLSELLTYVNLASQSEHSLIDSDESQIISWRHPDGFWRRAQLPLVVFTR